MTRLLLAACLAALVAAGSALAGNGSGGVTGPAFYVDGQLYRTVNTPTDLSNTGAPLHSFDTIYALAGQPFNVATAAPGDGDYNGGRWMVHAVAYNTSYAATVAAHDANGSGDLDSDAEILAAFADPAMSGTAGRSGVMNAQCGRYSAPFSIHCSRIAICCADKVLCVDSGGMRSSTSVERMRRTSSLRAASPGTIACLPGVSGSSAVASSRRSSRRSASRDEGSGPWHLKQFSERIGRTCQL